MSTTRLQRIDPDRNMARFYEIALQPTLFGDLAVIRYWGRIGTRGQSKSTWLDDVGAKDLHDRLRQRKAARGYRPPSPAHGLPHDMA